MRLPTGSSLADGKNGYFLLFVVFLTSRSCGFAGSLYWVAQVLLAPLLMGAVLAGLTLWLARQELGPSCLVVESHQRLTCA